MRTRRAVIIIASLAALALCACTPMAATYEVDVIDVQGEWGQLMLQKDEAFCRRHALAHKPPISARAIGNAGAQGGLANASPAAAAAAASPPSAVAIVVAGAAGGAGQEGLAELGLNDPQQVKILARCVDARGKRSSAYSVTDPNL